MGAAPSTDAARAYLFADGTPKKFSGKLRQLQADEAIEYAVLREAATVAPALIDRRAALQLDADADAAAGAPLYLEVTCTLAHCGIVDEPMAVCVDVFDGALRAHCVSPTKPELGGVVLCAQPRVGARTDPLTVESIRKAALVAEAGAPAPAPAPAADAFKLVGGDEYWWIGYPPIITVAPPAPPDAAPPEPDHFMGSFFEKAVALDGLSG